MKTPSLLFSGIALLFIGLTSFNLPQGWVAGGNNPTDYEIGLAIGEGRNGSNCATIKAAKAKARGFGSLHQGIIGRMYNGKKIKLTVYMKTEGTSVRKWAGFWLSIVAGKNQMLTADISGNVKDEGNSGWWNGTWSSDWKKYEITASIPEDSYWIEYGGQMAGRGQMWFDDVQIEVIDAPVSLKSKEIPPLPANLDFEE
jgi:hypothetical protein